MVRSSVRLQHEAELKQLEEETARRLEEEIRKRVEEKLSSEEVRIEVERLIEEGRKKLFDDVESQLQKEKEAALSEARQKEVSFCGSIKFLSAPISTHLLKRSKLCRYIVLITIVVILLGCLNLLLEREFHVYDSSVNFLEIELMLY